LEFIQIPKRFSKKIPKQSAAFCVQKVAGHSMSSNLKT